MKKLMVAQKGFTLVELVIIMIVLGILATLAYTNLSSSYKVKSYHTRSIAELNAMANGTNLYVSKYNDYPGDEARNIPAGIKEFVQGQENVDEWPAAPYPGSVYDYDYWPADENGPLDTYQISLRFCNAGDHATCNANAQKYLSEYVSAETLEDWDANSSMYYCLKGSCRSHQSQPMNHPGYCVNCGDQQ